MPNTREKLIELLDNFTHNLSPYAGDNKYFMVDDNCELADHLIANGVTLDKQVASSSKQLASSEWISVKDRLPEKYGRYLALTPSRLKGKEYDEWMIYYLPQSGFYDTDPEWGDIEMDDVTHWMPLPQPPEGE